MSSKIFPQHFPELDPDWLALHHPIPNVKFPPITAFLKLAFSPPPCHIRFSCKIFPQDFPKLDPDWLAPHHPIQNAKFPPITAFLKLSFCPPPCPARFPTAFLATFPTTFPTKFPTKFATACPTRFSRNIFPQDFLASFSHRIFLSWILIGWLPITLFKMLNFHQSLPFLNWPFALLPVLQDFPQHFLQHFTHFPHNFPQHVRQNFPTTFFPLHFPARFFYKIFAKFVCLVAHIGSSDPVRVLRLYTTNTLDEACSIYC